MKEIIEEELTDDKIVEKEFFVHNDELYCTSINGTVLN